MEYWLAGAAAICFASIIGGYSGFGFSMVAVPSLALLMPAKDAVIICLVIGVVVSWTVAIRYRRRVDHGIWLALSVGSVPGVLVGSFIFASIGDEALRIPIGIMTLAFALYSLLGKPSALLRISPVRSGAVGVSSGVLTSTIGMGGPPVIAYLVAGVEDSDTIRATLLGFFAVVSALAVGILWLHGEVGSGSLALGLLMCPLSFLGFWVGARLFSRFERAYRSVVAVLLLCLGIAALLGSV